MKNILIIFLLLFAFKSFGQVSNPTRTVFINGVGVPVSGSPPFAAAGFLWFQAGKFAVYNGTVWQYYLTETLAATTYAPLASPTFTGVPAAPTATAGTNTTQLATTAFTTTANNLKANIASPSLTGTPLTPTPASNVNTTQIVNGAWVNTYYAPIASVPTFTNYTASGTGAATTITITHGISGISGTSKVIVQPLNVASAGVQYATISSTQVSIVYTVAPLLGAGNLSYSILIKP